MFGIFIVAACEAREARPLVRGVLPRLGGALRYACKIRGPIRMHMQLTAAPGADAPGRAL